MLILVKLNFFFQLLISCLRGLRNIIVQNPQFLKEEINILLGIIKIYMIFNIKGVNFTIPQKITPSTQIIPEPSMNAPREKKGGKVMKQRKQRIPGAAKKDLRNPDKLSEHVTDNRQGYVPANINFDSGSDSENKNVFYGNRLIKTSDSDFSDSDSGLESKIAITEGRVRQAALHLFLHAIKGLEKNVIFSYWTHFIPDSSLSEHSLASCILKDPSPRGRMAALNVLLAFLTSSKLYLHVAEYNEKTSSFTPFSIILGTSLQELHRCLILALNENSLPVLLQVLKCLASLVQSTPYSKLKCGMISKIVRNVKGFIYHRDLTVQVGALIVLGCVLASEPLVPETKEIFLKKISKTTLKNTTKNENNISDKESKINEEEFEYANFSSDEEVSVSISNEDTPWILDKCLLNLGVSALNCEVLEHSAANPVKLESLQLLTVISRNYFECLIAPYLGPLTKALEINLMDKYLEVRVHTAKAIDFIGQAINQYFSNTDLGKGE